MFFGFLTTENLLLITSGLVTIIIVLVVDRLVRRAIARYSKRLKLEPHVENIFKLIARIPSKPIAGIASFKALTMRARAFFCVVRSGWL